MANKTRSLILVISTLSACLLSASERDQEDIKYVKPFFAVAHAAGSIHKCGVSEEVGDQVL